MVYCWTKRVGGLKSHSWSSGHTTSGLLDRRESAESSGRMTGAKSNWLSRARQWTHLQLIQWRKRANEYTSSYSEQWTTLRQKKLQLLRYSASACFLLAALVSIIVTFVPSSVGSSSPNATVIPGQRSARWNSACTHSIRELIFYIYMISFVIRAFLNVLYSTRFVGRLLKQKYLYGLMEWAINWPRPCVCVVLMSMIKLESSKSQEK